LENETIIIFIIPTYDFSHPPDIGSKTIEEKKYDQAKPTFETLWVE
jgi:hypothetical protein